MRCEADPRAPRRAGARLIAPAWRLALVAACSVVPCASASAQSWSFPDYLLPTSEDGAALWVGGDVGSGRLTGGGLGAWGARGTVHVAFSRLSLAGGAGMVRGADGRDREKTVMAKAGFGVPIGGAELTIQGGIGWMGPEFALNDNASYVRFPLGVGIGGRMGQGSVRPWIMPRVEMNHVSEYDDPTDFFENTNFALGLSGGISMAQASGLGIHGVVDIASETRPTEDDAENMETVLRAGVSLRFRLGGSRAAPSGNPPPAP